MEAKTIRVFWREARSGWFNFNWNGVITAHSVVHVSACEWRPPFNTELDVRHRGDATIGVKNVRPHGPNPGSDVSGGVEFFLQIDWNGPLAVVVDITVLGVPDDKVVL
jgi:hypothetical protein